MISKAHISEMLVERIKDQNSGEDMQMENEVHSDLDMAHSLEMDGVVQIIDVEFVQFAEVIECDSGCTV